MSRSRDSGMNRDRDRDTRDRDRKREREKDADRVRSRDRDHVRDRVASREQDSPPVRGEQEKHRDRGDQDRHRDKADQERARDREAQERPRDRGRRSWSRERPRDKRGRDRLPESSPVRSPVRSRRDRSPSPKDVRHRRRSPSPKDVRQRRQQSPSRPSPRHERAPKHDQRISTSAAARNEDGGDNGRERTREESSPQQDNAVTRMKEIEAALEAKETNKEKPSFEYSGKLAAETNKVKGVTLQFTEPPESRKPTTRWRLYVFKDGEPLNDPLYIHRQTCYLFGRERRVADVPTDHPSCSKQHAVIQYRLTEKEEADGSTSTKVRPYVMDLGSTNGTLLNSERIEAHRYYEMFEKDTIKFGNSSREYVLLHEHSIG